MGGYVFSHFKEQPVEKRSDSYTDALLELLRNRAEGAQAIQTGATATESACRGLWGRAFSAARVTPLTPATASLTAANLSLIGRDLADFGQSVWEIGVMDGMVKLTRASDWDIRDHYIRLSITTPDSIVTRYLPHESVLDLKIDAPIRLPWDGSAPVEQAGETFSLLASIERRLREEVSGPVGNLIPVPEVSDATAGLQKDINELQGRTKMVESTAGDWDQGPSATAPRTDFKPNRLGADPPLALVQLRETVCADVAGAYGVPAVLLSLQGDGSRAREAYRFFLRSTIVPYSEQVLSEMRMKLDTPDLEFKFDRLAAADVASLARAAMQLVSAGADIDTAIEAVGLEL